MLPNLRFELAHSSRSLCVRLECICWAVRRRLLLGEGDRLRAIGQREMGCGQRPF